MDTVKDEVETFYDPTAEAFAAAMLVLDEISSLLV